jgi:polysaccharide biosynthesis transport protein
VQTMLQLVTSAPVLAAVDHELGSEPPVQATEVGQTNIIAITALAGQPGYAARVANAYAHQFVTAQQRQAVQTSAQAETDLKEQISATARQVARLRAAHSAGTSSALSGLVSQEAVLRSQLSQVEVSEVAPDEALVPVTPAEPPASPSSPKPAQDAAIGLAAGLLLGLGAAFLRDSLDDAITSKETAEEIAGAPVLAAVPMVGSWRKRDRPLVVTLARPRAPATEAYRSLRTSLQFARQEHELRTILVTSPAAAEGKTSTLANLGAVFAQAGQRVLMVSCDLRKPRLGEFFGVDERAGLTTAILGEGSLEQLIRPAPGTASLWLLPSGPTPPNPAELLSGARAREIFAQLRADYDLVLIDSPPVLPVTDAVVLSRDADATLLVAAAFRTRSGDLLRATEKLAQVNAQLVGVVLNEATRQGSVYYGRYGKHGGYYGTGLADLLTPADTALLNGHANGTGVLPAANGHGNGNGTGPKHRSS